MALDYNQIAQAGNFLSSFNSFGNTRHDIITVNGLQEAKDFKLNRNERVALIDSNDDILYIKECDDIGKYNLKVFKCENITEQYMQTVTPASISKAEFDSLKNDMSELKAMLIKLEGNSEHNVKQQYKSKE